MSKPKKPKMLMHLAGTYPGTGPVAGAAKQGNPDRKIMRTFNRRTNDYARVVGGARKLKDGFRRPGSMQKGRCR